MINRFRGYTVTTPPAFDPVSLYEFKSTLRQCPDDTDEDAYLSSLISAATTMVEQYQRRAIIQRDIAMTMDRLCDPMLPVLPNLVSISSITYLDTAGDQQTLSTDLYDVDTASVPARITKAYGIAYPTTQVVESAVTINYTAGYAKYTGTFNSTQGNTVSVDFTDTLPPVGILYLINATGQYEAYSYRNAYNNSNVWSLTLPTVLCNTYADDDVVEVHAVPETTRQAILAIASDMYEHPAMSAEVSLSENKTAKMLLGAERVPEFY